MKRTFIFALSCLGYLLGFNFSFIFPSSDNPLLCDGDIELSWFTRSVPGLCGSRCSQVNIMNYSTFYMTFACEGTIQLLSSAAPAELHTRESFFRIGMIKSHLLFWVFKKMEDNHQSFLWRHWCPCFGFQSQGGSPSLNASLPTCIGFLRFTSGVIPADLLMVSMAAGPFNSHTCHIQP